MKTLDQVLNLYKSDCLDGRDLNRLAKFIPENDLSKLGLELKDEYKGTHVEIELSRENILKELEHDLNFAFEKALDQRGISASLMFNVIRMWNWILEDGLENWNPHDYALYGLPLLKATAIKYGFDNPIGDDSGQESKYAC